MTIRVSPLLRGRRDIVRARFRTAEALSDPDYTRPSLPQNDFVRILRERLLE
jgi:hypothetical protein